MKEIFFSLHDYMLHTESITYFLMLGTLIGITGFWFYLTERDED